MKRIKIITGLIISMALANCESEKHQFPIEKRYWNVDDYTKVVLELNYGYKNDEKLPNFSDPESRKIVDKLVDHQNFNIVLDDHELGLKHRNGVASNFFSKWRDMTKIYDALDRKDQYLYDKEMLAVWHFGLDLQLKYFKLGNEELLESSDDPNSFQTKGNINTNINTLIDNYLIYLNELNNEKAFTDSGKTELAKGIDTYFFKLIELYPDANYYAMKNKSELLLRKCNSEEVKASLTKLITLIDSQKSEN